jgi:hypothetical protein
MSVTVPTPIGVTSDDEVVPGVNAANNSYNTWCREQLSWVFPLDIVT